MTTVLTTEPIPEGADLVVTVGREDDYLITTLYRQHGATWKKLDPEDSLAYESPYYDMPAGILVERDRLSGYLALTTIGGTTIPADELSSLPERTILAGYTHGSNYPTILQRIHGEWWDMETPMTEWSGEIYKGNEVSSNFERVQLLWRADIDSIPERPEKRRPTPTTPPQAIPPKPTRDSLREQLLELIPAPEVSQRVSDWPQDEQDFYRDGYESSADPGGWNSFTNRAERLDLIRKGKAADSILDLLTRERLIP